MANATPEAIAKLASRYEQATKILKASVTHSSGEDSDFLGTIHRAGWTTLIDVARAESVLEAFEYQAQATAAAHKALVHGARSSLAKTASA